MNIRNGLLAAALLAMTLPAAAPAFAAIDEEWVGLWRSDLELAMDRLAEVHPDAFAQVDRAELEADFAALIERVPALDHHEIAVELARLVARVGDGHTRLTLPFDAGVEFFTGHSSTPEPKVPGLVFRHYPIRVHVYSDGVHVRRIDRAHDSLAGARVVSIGGMTIDEAVAAVGPVVQRDNDMQLQYHLAQRLVVPEVLHGRGVVDDMARAAWVLETAGGERVTLQLAPVASGAEVDWADARDSAAAPTPLYLRDTETHFWFEYLEAEQVVSLQYNTVYNMPDETLRAFTGRVLEFIDSHPVRALVIDLRWNRGGNNSVSRPLLYGLIRAPKLQRPGSLFAITGRRTFSAAMMFSVDLEKHTPALFVGEPTGSRGNHHGDSRKILLPNTGLTLRVSTLYWQYSHPGDDRPWIEPHFDARLSSADYRENRDPALERIVELVGARAAATTIDSPNGKWSGAAEMTFNRLPVTLSVRTAGSDLEAVLDAAWAGMTDVSLDTVRFEAPSLHFKTEIDDVTITFDGQIHNGNTLIGEAHVSGYLLPIVLHRR